MVRPVVPEFQLMRLQSQRETDDLMAEADPEDGPLAEEGAYRRNRVRDTGRVAGAVREENPVRMQRQGGVGCGRGRDDRDLEAFVDQTPQNIVLDPEVIGHDSKMGGCPVW